MPKLPNETGTPATSITPSHENKLPIRGEKRILRGMKPTGFVRLHSTLGTSVLALVILLIHCIAAADETFSGEFKLKAKDPAKAKTFSPEYHIVIKQGVATVKYSTEGKPKTAQAVTTFTLLNGLDVETKRPAPLTGSLSFDIINPGWAKDKFVTRLTIPIEGAGKGEDVRPVFGKVASLQFLWLDVFDNGFIRYTDPMGARHRLEYLVEVIADPLKDYNKK